MSEHKLLPTSRPHPYVKTVAMARRLTEAPFGLHNALCALVAAAMASARSRMAPQSTARSASPLYSSRCLSAKLPFVRWCLQSAVPTHDTWYSLQFAHRNKVVQSHAHSEWVL